MNKKRQQFLLFRDSAATESLFGKHRPTHVIHLAAMTGGLAKHTSCNLEFYVSNML